MLGGEDGITFESIHGGDTSVIRAADLDLDRFIPRGGGGAALVPASELPAAPTAVLLTGANGFLGRFLLLELLQRVARQCAQFIFLVLEHDTSSVYAECHPALGCSACARSPLSLCASLKWAYIALT